MSFLFEVEPILEDFLLSLLLDEDDALADDDGLLADADKDAAGGVFLEKKEKRFFCFGGGFVFFAIVCTDNI